MSLAFTSFRTFSLTTWQRVEEPRLGNKAKGIPAGSPERVRIDQEIEEIFVRQENESSESSVWPARHSIVTSVEQDNSIP